MSNLQSFVDTGSAIVARRVLDRSGYAYNLKQRIHDNCLGEIERRKAGEADTLWLRAVDERGIAPLLDAAAQGHRGIVGILLAAGANINAFDRNGWTPLHNAANHGRDVVISDLLAAGANPFALDTRGLTPRDVAVEPSTQAILNRALAWTKGTHREKPARIRSAIVVRMQSFVAVDGNIHVDHR